MSIQELVSIREFQKSDVNFLLSSSIQCLIQYLSSTYKGWNKDDLYQDIEKKILFALNKLDYSVFIACDVKDSEHILGYIVADSKNNHILLQYTKYAYRKLGIQKHLLLPLVVDLNEPVSVQWNTKEMIKLHKLNRIVIKDLVSEQLIKLVMEKV